jgi:hypothetical protein
MENDAGAEPPAEQRSWWSKHERLKAYVVENGRIPACKETAGSFKIGQWVARQRRTKKGKGTSRLTPPRVSALEAIPGWYWDRNLDSAAWQEKFGMLEEYVAKNNRLPTRKTCIGGFKVGQWINKVRMASKGLEKRRLTSAQIRALEGIPGWCWDLSQAWDRKFAMAKVYALEHGHPPAQRVTVGGVRVGNWVRNQRVVRKKQGRGRITDEQIRALETLPGWHW